MLGYASLRTRGSYNRNTNKGAQSRYVAQQKLIDKLDQIQIDPAIAIKPNAKQKWIVDLRFDSHSESLHGYRLCYENEHDRHIIYRRAASGSSFQLY